MNSAIVTAITETMRIATIIIVRSWLVCLNISESSAVTMNFMPFPRVVNTARRFTPLIFSLVIPELFWFERSFIMDPILLFGMSARLVPKSISGQYIMLPESSVIIGI